ncbi:hypothetical protein DL96DRAFT_1615105 [Flagelloscypha sp. PMI_526]|nr:hypothetical protein DL96DRAFT_1615105 [Flagelloscypha sp. PMI_526]
MTRLLPAISGRLHSSLHREECTQCFISQDSPSGAYVCLHCFNGSCVDNRHLELHAQKTKHVFYLHVLRTKKEKEERGEPPAKMTKLAIVEEKEEDLYEWKTVLGFWNGSFFKSIEEEAGLDPTKAKELKEGIMLSMSSGRQSEVKAWEEEFEGCEHGFLIAPEGGKQIDAQGTAHCNDCDLTTNLWLCLTCGNLGCGRQQYGGAPSGNGHGLAHFDKTKHHMSVKLGTITPEGGADVHCYTCNDSRLLPQLKDHLAVWGININVLTKTEKSMTELQIDQNLKYDFSMSSSSDEEEHPVFGPGLTGLKNLGNSYKWRGRYTLDRIEHHWKTCTETRSAECFECQISKVAHGLTTGAFSVPSTIPTEKWQDGLRPTGFKELIGKGHPEFATMKQQDAEEFLVWVLETYRRDLFKRKHQGDASDEDPTETFGFGFEQRLECLECKKVRYSTEDADVVSVAIDAVEDGKIEDDKPKYKPVSLDSALRSVIHAPSPSMSSVQQPGELLTAYKCPSCSKPTTALKSTLFSTLPETLVIHAKKFKVVGWVPQKLEIPLLLPDDVILEFTQEWVGTGQKEGEVLLPEDEGEDEPEPEPTFNEMALIQIESMGFPVLHAKKALLAVGGENVEGAMEWLFSKVGDPSLDEPLTTSKKKKGGKGGKESTEEQISIALGECDGNAERAVEWLFSHPDETPFSGSSSADDAPAESKPVPTPKGSKTTPARYKLLAFISHKGPSVHSGHYVAHIRHPQEGWVLFNDEKVGRVSEESVKEMRKEAYVYFWKRI